MIHAAKLVLPTFQAFGACAFILLDRPMVSFFLALTAGISLLVTAVRGR